MTNLAECNLCLQRDCWRALFFQDYYMDDRYATKNCGYSMDTDPRDDHHRNEITWVEYEKNIPKQTTTFP